MMWCFVFFSLQLCSTSNGKLERKQFAEVRTDWGQVYFYAYDSPHNFQIICYDGRNFERVARTQTTCGNE